jgi:hypothetical protein
MKELKKYFFVIYFAGSVVCAQNLYVNNLIGSDANNGLSPTITGVAGDGPKATVSNAITAATAGSIIYIAATGVNYVESPNVNKLVTFIGYSVTGTTEKVTIDLSGGNMIFNVASGSTIFFMALPIAGSGYSYPAAAGFHFKGTATTGFYFQSGYVLQVNTTFTETSPFRYQR